MPTRSIHRMLVALTALMLISWSAYAQDSGEESSGESDSTSSLHGTLVAQNDDSNDSDEGADDGDADDEGEDGESEGESGGEGEGEEGAQTANEPTPTLQRGSRMEFDGRLIRGESAGSGAVFLFERVPRKLPSMVDRRTSYLDQTVETILGTEATEEFARKKKKELESRRTADSDE